MIGLAKLSYLQDPMSDRIIFICNSVEVVTANSMVQIHEQPTRGNNLLDIVLTTNSSLIKSSNNAPGISDHDMVATDCDTKPYYQSKRPRKCYIYSKAIWDKLHEDLTKQSSTIIKGN